MQNEILINAFGVPVRQFTPGYVDDYEKTKIKKYGLELDKETGTTKAVIAEVIDTDELIQSYKESCGMECAQKMIRSGLVAPDAYADDGKHGGDLSNVPDYAGDLIRQQIEAQAQKAAVMQAYGLTDEDLASGDLESVIKAAVDKRIAEIQAKAQAAQKEGE